MAIQKKKIIRTGREKRKIRIAKKLASASDRCRLSVFKSSKHTYAQIIMDGKTLASASTLDKDVLDATKKAKVEGESKAAKSTKSVCAAKAVGMIVAQKCVAKEIKEIVFDRNGFAYHGRIKAVAEGAREGGLNF